MNKDLVVAHIHKGILCIFFLIALELGKRKTEVPGENFPEEDTEPTTNLTMQWCCLLEEFS